MRIKITVSPSPAPLPEGCGIQHFINGYFHKTVLGKENTYHDAFSNYSLSSMQGGVFVDGRQHFPNGGCFYVSSPDSDLMSKVFFGVKRGHLIYNMKVANISVEDFECYSRYDIVTTIDPILLKDKEKNPIFYDDPRFIPMLTDKCRRKLIHNGIDEKEASQLSIEPFHFESATKQFRRIKNVLNIGSNVSLRVVGSQRSRHLLYELGLGYSTGCGFGAVNVVSRNVEQKRASRKWANQ